MVALLQKRLHINCLIMMKDDEIHQTTTFFLSKFPTVMKISLLLPVSPMTEADTALVLDVRTG